MALVCAAAGRSSMSPRQTGMPGDPGRVDAHSAAVGEDDVEPAVARLRVDVEAALARLDLDLDALAAEDHRALEFEPQRRRVAQLPGNARACAD